MRRAARTDSNQTEIIAALRAIGATVHVTSLLGGGFPDIAVGYRNKNVFLEIKDGEKPPSRRQLTTEERDWQAAWRGQVATVSTIDEAIAEVTR